jgi:carbon monoxide dehydrogenase subunit G
MRYSCQIEIDKPIDEVVRLFDDPDNLKEWMEGLQSFEHISGTPGQPGAKSKLVFKMGKRDVEMIETVTVNNLPEEFSGTYEAKGVYNHVMNSFQPIADNKTLYITQQEFKLQGFMKIIGFLMPGTFKKQSIKYLEHFKAFVEKQ